MSVNPVQQGPVTGIQPAPTGKAKRKSSRAPSVTATTMSSAAQEAPKTGRLSKVANSIKNGTAIFFKFLGKVIWFLPSKLIALIGYILSPFKKIFTLTDKQKIDRELRQLSQTGAGAVKPDEVRRRLDAVAKDDPSLLQVQDVIGHAHNNFGMLTWTKDYQKAGQDAIASDDALAKQAYMAVLQARLQSAK
jgi:hypothetical protein